MVHSVFPAELRAGSRRVLWLIALFGCTVTSRSVDADDSADVLDRRQPAKTGAFAETGEYETDLTSFSLEELMAIEVSSVRRKTEKLIDAAAAVFVITRDDIRRSGVRSVPEALRMVPGVQVARIDANKWAISARGFNGRFSNKLLVLIDGRSVYTPLFSGVFWETHDVLLEDIERIEVIRGPGGTLWGANAVNGVINIITKSAEDTQGTYVGGGGGTENLGFGEGRYGGKIGPDLSYRVYAKYGVHDGFVDADGDRTDDDWQSLRGGLRIDWQPRESDRLTFLADAFYVRAGAETVVPTLTPPFVFAGEENAEVNGQNLLARWTHDLSDTSDFTLQLYWDRTDRDDINFEEERNTVDVHLQHRFALPLAQDVLWGVNYRATYDELGRRDLISFSPRTRDLHLVSLFLQDDISLFDDLLRLTVGSKLDYNDQTDFEVQPSARLLWAPHERHRIWAAVSRAVRTPTRGDEDASVFLRTQPTAPLPTKIVVEGNRRFTSEDLLAFELGYRGQLHDTLSLDVTGFYNRYDNLRTLELGTAALNGGPPAHVVQPLIFDNKGEADTYGVEVSTTWRPLEWWRLAGTFSFMTIDVHLDSDSTDFFTQDNEDQTPTHQVSLRSSFDLPWDLELDTSLYYVDHLGGFDTGNVSSYVRLDIRLGWRPFGDDTLDVVVGLQNLLDSQHPEFATELYEQATEIETAFYAMLSLRF